MTQKLVGIVGFTLILLFLVFSVPGFVGAGDATVTNTQTINHDVPTDINGGLEITISGDETSIDITGVRLDTGDTDTITLSSGETGNMTLGGETVTFEATDLQNDRSTITTTLPSTFGLSASTPRGFV